MNDRTITIDASKCHTLTRHLRQTARARAYLLHNPECDQTRADLAHLERQTESYLRGLLGSAGYDHIPSPEDN